MVRSLPVFLLLAAAVTASGQARPHNFDLLDVDWSVRLDEPTRSLKGDVTNTLRPINGAEKIDLDFTSLTVDEVTVNGEKATFTHRSPVLSVSLPKPADGLMAMRIRIKYHGVPESGVYFVPGKRAFPATTPVVYTQGEMVDTRCWLPTYDWPDDKATSQGTLDVPEGWFALSNGKLVSQESANGRSVFRWRMDQAHVTYLISFAAGPFDEGKEEWDGIPVNFYVPKGLKDQGEKSFLGTADMVEYFSELTGFRYPFAKYTQVAVPDFMFGGMENITATTNTINTLHPKSCGDLRDSAGLVAHELAHQWFGDTVTCNGWADAWINEGWATFLPNFYFRKTRGQDAFDLGRYDCFQGGLGAHAAEPGRGVVFGGYNDPLENFDGYIYAGGAARMFMLMDMLGEKEFWAITSKYLQDRKYTSFDTHAFFETWSKHSGRNLDEFKKQWFYTPAAPKLTLTRSGGNVVITQPAPFFTLDVPIWWRKDGQWTKSMVQIREAQTRIAIPEGAGVLLDPECWLMAEINDQVPTSVPMLIEMFKNAPNAGTQARMIDSRLGGFSVEDRLAVAKSIKSKLVLQRYIGHLRGGSETYLMSLLKDEDPRIVDSAVNKLNELRSDTALSAIREIAESSPNPALRSTGMRALLNLTDDSALADKLWATDSFEDAYRQIALDWWRSKHPDVCREKALEAIERGLPEPTRVDAIRHLGGLKDKPDEKRVFEALAAILNEPSFGARNTAINALADYGDRAAIGLIEPFLKHELVFFRGTAKGAIDRLRG